MNETTDLFTEESTFPIDETTTTVVLRPSKFNRAIRMSRIERSFSQIARYAIHAENTVTVETRRKTNGFVFVNFGGLEHIAMKVQ